MRPKKARKPLTLYKKLTQYGFVWYARFWDETAKRYAATRSTSVVAEGKKQCRYEAEQAAMVKKRPLSVRYIQMNSENIRLHIATSLPFQTITLRCLTPALIRDWMIWMAEKGLSGRRINQVLQVMRVATRYAVSREELSRDPFKGIGEATETTKEKGILTHEEIQRLICAPIVYPRARLAVLLGVLCGMRRGEVRACNGGTLRMA
jgi:integrase